MKKIFITLLVCIFCICQVSAFNIDIKKNDDFNDEFSNDRDLNMRRTAQVMDFSFENMGDFFNIDGKCDSNKEDCTTRPEYKFYLKLYDLYYLYLSKYDVNLDLSLIVATLFANENDVDKVFEMNLSDYNRKLIVESDWKPTEITELDWDYDYESKDNYLVANDSSMDMQVLAKNMVTKTTTQKCVKDKKIMKTKKVKDSEEDLVCDEGEKLEKGNETYNLDLEKYDDFLLEYIEKKYFISKIVLFPVRSKGPDYYTTKKPSVINRIKKGNKSTTKDGDYVSNVSFLDGKFGKIFYFNQCEEPYSSHSYGGYGSICTHGCGPTSLAIVISSLYGEEHNPIELTDYVCESGGCSYEGSYHSAIASTAEHYGLKVNKTGDTQAVIDALSSGKALVIAIMCPGHFTTGGHFITLTGANSNGQVTVADPYSRERSTDWDFNTIVEETCNSDGSPFWIITR